MSAPIIDEASKVFADPTSYADEPRLHAALTHLRTDAPVSLVEQLEVLLEFLGYFNARTASRREQPTEDLASAIANARVDGQPLSDVETTSYYVIIAPAGHDTTSATIAGGLQALIENPDQRKRLSDNLDLIPLATEEMIRWVTPVKELMRTATADTSIRGVPIAQGESCGVHFCLGAALARMEVNSFFTELLPRLKTIEFNGNPGLISTTFVGGLKHLPIRYQVR